MPNYGDAKYWDDRYTQQKNTTFDWLEGWDDLKDLIEKFAVDGLYKPLNTSKEAEQKLATEVSSGMESAEFERASDDVSQQIK